MADLFTNSEALSLFRDKFVLFMGDSNMKAIFKDVVFILTKSKIIPVQCLRKGERLLVDKIIRIPPRSTNGRDYFEEREFKGEDIHLRFHFLTKVNGAEMENTLRAIERGDIPVPDILILSSCVWDLTRWGPPKPQSYKNDLIEMFCRVKHVCRKDTLIIWISCPPVSARMVKGGVLVQQIEFMKYNLCFMIIEANKVAHQICVRLGVDFLDIHYHLRFQLHRRSIDGLHWEPQALRHVTCIILTHISLALGIPLPGHVKSKYLTKCIERATEPEPIDKASVYLGETVEGKIKKALLKYPPNSKEIKECKKTRPPTIGESTRGKGVPSKSNRQLESNENRIAKGKNNNGREIHIARRTKLSQAPWRTSAPRPPRHPFDLRDVMMNQRNQPVSNFYDDDFVLKVQQSYNFFQQMNSRLRFSNRNNADSVFRFGYGYNVPSNNFACDGNVESFERSDRYPRFSSNVFQ